LTAQQIKVSHQTVTKGLFCMTQYHGN